MSRAFVNEELAGSRPEPPVERPVSDHPNHVTARGLQQLQQRVTRLLAEVAAAQGLEDGDAQQLAELERDLHYYQQRLQAAVQVMPAVSRDMVQIGSRVAYATPDGHEHEVQIVGEDEADPAGGLVSWESPLGQALIGAAPGEEVRWVRPAGDLLIEVLEIIPEPH